MILKKFLNFWKSEPRDSYKNNSYNRKRVYMINQNTSLTMLHSTWISRSSRYPCIVSQGNSCYVTHFLCSKNVV